MSGQKKLIFPNAPNFLIVGAAKSGSTSLYKYLCQHPEVFMPRKKEPNFFVSDYQKLTSKDCPSYKIDRKRMVFNDKEYFSLFEKANKNHKAIGEASVTYLYKYDEAIKKIKLYLGDPRIIIILRNPIFRSFSQYTYGLELGFENLSFVDAIKAENSRMKKKWSSTFAYINQGMVLNQIKAFFDAFSDVHVIILEEFINQLQFEMKRVYQFLDIDDTFQNIFTEDHNVSGIPKNKFLHKFLIHNNNIKDAIRTITSPFIDIKYFRKLNRYLRNMNHKGRIKISDNEIEILNDIYRDEIKNVKEYLKLNEDLWVT